MKISFGDNNKHFIKYIRETSSSHLQLGTERYTSWIFGCLFSITYHNGEEFKLGRRNYPIFNKLIGICINTKNNSYIRYFFFAGLTDPLSFIILYLSALMILILTGSHKVMPFTYLNILSLGWTIAVGILTFLETRFSTIGKEGRKQLKSYLENFPKYEENLKKYEQRKNNII